MLLPLSAQSCCDGSMESAPGLLLPETGRLCSGGVCFCKQRCGPPSINKGLDDCGVPGCGLGGIVPARDTSRPFAFLM